MPLTCVGKKEILEREKHQQRTYVGKCHVHFPFLAMVLEHLELGTNLVLLYEVLYHQNHRHYHNHHRNHDHDQRMISYRGI